MTMVPVISFILGAQAAAPVITVATVVGSLGRIAIFGKSIEWPIVKWALPGAVAGAAVGSYFFSILPVDWLQLALGVFLVSTVIQEYFSKSGAHFQVPMWAFSAVYFIVAGISAVMGAAGPVMNVFFLNAGILKERMVATKAAVSLPMQLTKVISYFAFGVLAPEYVTAGIIVGLGATLSNSMSRRMLARLSTQNFRYITVSFMVLAGLAMLWKQRGLVF